MKRAPAFVLSGLLFIAHCSQNAARAQDRDCSQVTILKKPAQAKSASDMARLEQAATQNYQLRVAFAARKVELNPENRAAASTLLALIPTNGDQNAAWITLGDSMCESESLHDMDSLDRIGSRFDRDLATAVILVPEKMPDYVAFAFEALSNPHSDYAVEMQRVCKVKHAELMHAVNGLPSDDRSRFVRSILDLETCKALRLSESD